MQSASAESGVGRLAMRPGVTGVVRDRIGRPQIGAAVELLNAHYAVVAQTFTDDRGHYVLPRVEAGVYQVKATASLLLPAIHPGLHLLAGTRAVVNLTLASLYQALDWLPAENRQPNSPEDDWDWTLRLSTNRPLLRVRDEDTARKAAKSGARDVQGSVLIEETNDAADRVTWGETVHSGLARFGEGGLEERAHWEGSGESRAVLLSGSVAAGSTGLGRAATTVAYRQELTPDRSLVTTATLAERPGIRSAEGSGLTTLRMRSASTLQVGDLLRLEAGTELAAARLGSGPVVAGNHPFASIAFPLGGGHLEYRIASAPTMTGTDALEREASEDAPAVMEVNGKLAMEQGLHQEIAFNRQAGSWTGELSVFDDALAHPLVEGAVQGAAPGDAAAIDSKDVLYDPETGMIAVSGQRYRHGGVMALLRDQLSPDTWLSFRYAMGEATVVPFEAGHTFGGRATPMVSAAAGTRVAETGTVVRGSYRWQPVNTVTQVAPFASGIPDAYLGLSLRQPLHLERVGAGKVEAILDIRNLLAEGYRPFLSQDGTTVYFAQAQRCIAGGISFSF